MSQLACCLPTLHPTSLRPGSSLSHQFCLLLGLQPPIFHPNLSPTSALSPPPNMESAVVFLGCLPTPPPTCLACFLFKPSSHPSSCLCETLWSCRLLHCHSSSATGCSPYICTEPVVIPLILTTNGEWYIVSRKLGFSKSLNPIFLYMTYYTRKR